MSLKECASPPMTEVQWEGRLNFDLMGRANFDLVGRAPNTAKVFSRTWFTARDKLMSILDCGPDDLTVKMVEA